MMLFLLSPPSEWNGALAAEAVTRTICGFGLGGCLRVFEQSTQLPDET